MSEIFNRYCHGYVAIPVIMACKARGLFKLLENEASVTVKAISKRLESNEGHLMVALRLLQSLSWLHRNEFGAYSLTDTAQIYKKITPRTLELYKFRFDKYLMGNNMSLQAWFNESEEWHKNLSSQWADILDGVLMVPLLIALHTYLQHPKLEQPILSDVDPFVFSELSRFLMERELCNLTEGKLYLNYLGKILVERALNMGLAASYRPLLTNISNLLFGDAKEIFHSDEYGKERHVDRTLNVITSGYQHGKYFSQMEIMVVEIYNRLPYEDQPEYILDIGCGDGTLLRNLHEKICANSLRGKVVGTHPVTLIGVDYSSEALNVTRETLKDLPHKLLIGDISKPQELHDELLTHGITADKVLLVRSFLDHDRQFTFPENSHALMNNMTFHGVFVDNDGGLIQPAAMVQNLVEHFQRWTKIVGSHGLLILEVHCLDPLVCQHYLDQCENAYFDALQGFSKQYLVDADTFYMAAARAGLFSKKGTLCTHPKYFMFTRITLSHFVKRNYAIRYATLNDVPSLIDLEVQCWGKKLGASFNKIQTRISNYPEGQCVLVKDGIILGVSYTQKVAKVEDLNQMPYKNIETLHVQHGPVGQLIALNILPLAQNQGLGDALLEFMLERFTLMCGIERVVGITRCRNYDKYNHLKYEDYITTCDEFGLLLDPVLNFHRTHGAKIIRQIQNYRPEDEENLGYGVLIEYVVKRHNF